MVQETMYAASTGSRQTALAALISQTATSITVADATALPAAPNLATIGTEDNAEVIQYAAKNGNQLTGVIRGFGGTTAQIWPAETPVYRAYTAKDHDAFCANIRTLDAGKADKEGDASEMTVAFTQAATRVSIESGQTLSALLGQILKWLSSLGVCAFTGFGSTSTSAARGNHTHSTYVPKDADGKATAAMTSAKSIQVTASRQLGLTDAGRCLDTKSTSTITLTIPTHATILLPIDTEIEVAREGTGRAVISTASGVALRGVRGTATSFEISNQYGVVVLKKKGENEWRIAGDFA